MIQYKDKLKNADKLIIFTDLDGTLLDHENYSYKPASEALAALRQNGSALIFASSKTAAEISVLQGDIGFADCPAIVENGAGILQPYAKVDDHQTQYFQIIRILNSLPSNLRLQFKGFGDLTDAEVSKLTGLNIDAARNARLRQFSEPGIWAGSDSEWVQFSSLLIEQGIAIQEGGRFKTLSHGATKADQVTEISAQYRNETGKVFTVALGDAPNDISMLETVNLGIIIPNNFHCGIPHLKGEEDGKIVRAERSGPEGWNSAIMQLINLWNQEG